MSDIMQISSKGDIKDVPPMPTWIELLQPPKREAYGKSSKKHDYPVVKPEHKRLPLAQRPCKTAGCKEPRHVTPAGIVRAMCKECYREAERNWRIKKGDAC